MFLLLCQQASETAQRNLCSCPQLVLDEGKFTGAQEWPFQQVDNGTVKYLTKKLKLLEEHVHKMLAPKSKPMERAH